MGEFATELSYETLTRAECVFAAIWNSPEGTVGTEAIARYYEVEVEKIFDVVDRHHEELVDTELHEDNWTPRGAIRLGMLLNSPVAASVRSLTLDIIEAHRQTNKKDAVRFLLENGQFVEWSNRSIAKILECHHKTVGDVRKRLEAENKIVTFTRRKHNRMGKTVERNDDKPTQPENQGSSPLMATVAMSDPQTLILPSDKLGEPQPNAEVLPDAAPILRRTPPPPKTYTEEELQQEIERAIAESKIGLKVKAEEEAIAVVQDQLIASRAIADIAKSENIALQQKIMELESLRLLEEENKRLLQRIKDLERSQEDRGTGWGNTFTKQAEKMLNADIAAGVKRIEQLEPELHLRAIALSPPPRKMYSEVAELLEQIRYQMDRVPLAGRRVAYEDRYGTLADIDDENETAVIDWDIPIKSDTPDDVYRLADIEVLPTLEGIAQGSNVSSCDVKNPAYSWHGVVVKVYPHTNEVDVHWREIGKIKCCRVSFLRLIVAKEQD